MTRDERFGALADMFKAWHAEGVGVDAMIETLSTWVAVQTAAQPSPLRAMHVFLKRTLCALDIVRREGCKSTARATALDVDARLDAAGIGPTAARAVRVKPRVQGRTGWVLDFSADEAQVILDALEAREDFGFTRPELRTAQLRLISMFTGIVAASKVLPGRGNTP